MKQIGVAISPHQRRRLHNGHPVRVKKGEGIMMVNPANFSTMSKTFLRGKAKEIQLSPEEIQANKMVSPEAHNYNRQELETSTVAPKIAPIKSAPAVGGRISNAGGPRSIRATTMGGLKQLSDHLQQLEDYTGGDYGDQLKAGLGKLMANMDMAGIREASINARKNILGGGNKKYTNFYGDNEIGSSSFGGFGIQGRRVHSQIGVSGNLLAQKVLPQALQSQPYSANWAMANQMPPQYQKFNRSV